MVANQRQLAYPTLADVDRLPSSRDLQCHDNAIVTRQFFPTLEDVGRLPSSRDLHVDDLLTCTTICDSERDGDRNDSIQFYPGSASLELRGSQETKRAWESGN